MENKIKRNKERMAEFKKIHQRQKRNTILVIVGLIAVLGFIIIRASVTQPRPQSQLDTALNLLSEIQGTNDAAALNKGVIAVVESVTADQVLAAAREYKNSSSQTKAQAITLLLSHIKSTPQQAAQLKEIMNNMLSLKSIQALADQIDSMGEMQFKVTFPIYKKAVVSYLKNNLKS